MTFTATHLRISLAVIALLGLAVSAALLWAQALPDSLMPVQQTVILIAAVAAAGVPLLGALMPTGLLTHPAAAAFPGLALIGFGALAGAGISQPLRLLVLVGAVLALLTVLAALFGRPDPTACADGPGHRFS